jgi:hypothetical protein
MIPQIQLGLLPTLPYTSIFSMGADKNTPLRQKRWFQCYHVYVPTFWLHRYMEYVSLSWSDISELVVPVMISLVRGLLLTSKQLNQGFQVVEMKFLKIKIWLTGTDYLYHKWSVQFFIITIRSFPHWWLVNGFVRWVTRLVQHFEKELLTIMLFNL